MKKKLLYPGAVAKLLGVSYYTIWRWTKKGWLKHYMSPGGRFRYDPEDIEAFKKRYPMYKEME